MWLTENNKDSHPTSVSWRACCAPIGCWRFPSGICHQGGGCALSSRHRQSCRSHYRGQQIDPGHPWPHWPLWCMALWDTGPDGLQEKNIFLTWRSSHIPGQETRILGKHFCGYGWIIWRYFMISFSLAIWKMLLYFTAKTNNLRGLFILFLS